MSATIPHIKTSSIQRVSSMVRDFRIIPRIETYPAVIAFVQTSLGKVVLLAVFGLGERFFLPDINFTGRIGASTSKNRFWGFWEHDRTSYASSPFKKSSANSLMWVSALLNLLMELA